MSYFGRHRESSARKASMPAASIFAHCAAVSRIERCSSFASGGVGGRPIGFLGCSMAIVYVLQKVLAMRHLLNHNNYISNAPGNDMASIKNFCDISGEAIELRAITQMSNKDFAAQFPGVKGFRADGYTMWVGHPMQGFGGLLPVTRKIEFKSFPSRHECNSKCLNGKANGTCECKCGGKNHGRGMFTQLLEAA